MTGASGFVGRHVRRGVGLGEFGDAVFIGLPDSCDIRDSTAVESFVSAQRPDSVLHLAAQSFVPLSFDNPRETFDVNVIGTLNVLLALRNTQFRGRLIYVSSGDVYGIVPDSALPVDETRLPAPLSPYGASKVASEQLCLQWHRSNRLDVVIARPFNHIGPGQDHRFVVPALGKQVVEIARGRQQPVVEVGDIETTRDFVDVRDVVTAYASIFKNGVSGRTYLVASGKERKIRDLLGMMCAISKIDPDIKQNPKRVRRSELRRMVADHKLLSADTGWQPKFALEQTLSEVLAELGLSDF